MGANREFWAMSWGAEEGRKLKQGQIEKKVSLGLFAGGHQGLAAGFLAFIRFENSVPAIASSVCRSKWGPSQRTWTSPASAEEGIKLVDITTAYSSTEEGPYSPRPEGRIRAKGVSFDQQQELIWKEATDFDDAAHDPSRPVGRHGICLDPKDGRVNVRVEADIVVERLKLSPAIEQVAHALPDHRVGAVADDPQVLQRWQKDERRWPVTTLGLGFPASIDLVNLEDNPTGHFADREGVAVVAVGRLEGKARRDEKRAIYQLKIRSVSIFPTRRR